MNAPVLKSVEYHRMMADFKLHYLGIPIPKYILSYSLSQEVHRRITFENSPVFLVN